MKRVAVVAFSLAVLPVFADWAVWPDYFGITVPPNIAPLNFRIHGAGDRSIVMTGADGASLAAETAPDGAVVWPEAAWHAFLDAHKGGNVVWTLKRGEETLVVTNAVSADPIDAYLTYRLIEPSYVHYGQIGIRQRDLTSFDERSLYRNAQSTLKQCINCHTYNAADPEQYLFHTRAYEPGTQIVSKKWGARKVNLKAPGVFGAGVYPAWHPSGDWIAFSVNETRQCFYCDDPDRIEVMDFRSDLVLYSLKDDTVAPVETTPENFETFPAWTPDGKNLFSVRACTTFTNDLDGIDARAERFKPVSHDVFYDLVVRPFDPEKGVFGEPRMLVDGRLSKKSITFPRVSPDGRWVVVTVGPYGNFHVWHREADLWLLDLKEFSLRPLDELNSDASESYHCFSHDGKWMVFSSRRDDGSYTRPYFAHFDAEAGRFEKPFILPFRHPDDHLKRFLSYNIPEFSTGPVRETPSQLRALVKGPAREAKIPEKK